MYCSLHGDNTSHTSRECTVLKAKGKEKLKFYKKDFKEVHLLEKQASHQRAKYLKYKNLNQAFSKNNTRVILDESESDSSISEKKNSSNEGEKNSITYDSESGESEKSSNIATDTEEEA